MGRSRARARERELESERERELELERESQWVDVSDGSQTEEFWEEEYYRQMRDRDMVPWYYVPVVVFVLLMIFQVSGYLGSNLPTPLTLEDDKVKPGSFIADRAGRLLVELTNFGPRPTGSYENEVLAADLLTQEVGYIAQQAHSSQQVMLDVQRVTGSYQVNFLDQLTFANSYSEVVNVVARLRSVGSTSNSSLLINCHFDTVPNSPGASDDALNCAVMLEVLRVLSQQATLLPNDVIFLFNGAGSMLKASHGFVTQHKWAKTVKAFVNLEACGVGGREMLFRAGPQHGWLVQLYASSVPYPHGQILAEDLYQDHLVPSDTDFRVFRDFGRVPGLDFAHAMNGYVYHTHFDTVELIPRGALQHTGANLLALTKAVASSPLLVQRSVRLSTSVPIYYDIIGFFMVCYTKAAAAIINILAAILSLYSGYRNMRLVMPGTTTNDRSYWLITNAFLVVAGWSLGYLCTSLFGLFLDNTMHFMTWFTNTSLSFYLFYVPMLALMIIPLLMQDFCKLRFLAPHSRVVQVFVNCCGVQLVWTSVLLITTLGGYRSAHVFLMMILSPSIASLLMHVTFVNKPVKTWLFWYSLSTLVPLPYLMYLTHLEFGVLIPVMGRIGLNDNPEKVISFLSCLTCIVMFGYLTPLLTLVKERLKYLVGLAALFLLTLVLAIYTPIGFPFSDNPKHPTPQRVAILHTERMMMNVKGDVTCNKSGYWVYPFDPLSVTPYRDYVPELKYASLVARECDFYPFCSMPIYWSTTVNMLRESLWVPAAPPVVQSPATLQLEERKVISSKAVRLALAAKGADNMVVYLVPAPNVVLVGWSFSPGQPSPIKCWWIGRPAYFIHHSSGSANFTLHFYLDFKVRDATDPIVDIGIVGHYFNDKTSTSEEFKKFVGKYPWWVAVTSWTATVKLYKH